MARHKHGDPVHGWLVLDKPAGPSSAAMVAKAKWAFGARKAGHAGTLDPAATGVLAIAFGEATKTVGLIADARKAYRFTVRWGAATTTDDAEGAVIETSAARPDPAAIRAALAAFTGDILQTPPQVSAVKVDGERAYDLARSGDTVLLAARPLHVARLALVDCPDADTAVLEMDCGKGGYVRAIARDLGAALGCLGHVVSLRRLWSGPFALDHAIDAARLEAAARTPEIRLHLLPVAVALAGLPEIPVSAQAASALRHGHPVPLDAAPPGAEAPAWASHAGAPVAVGTCTGGLFRPLRVFVFEDRDL